MRKIVCLIFLLITLPLNAQQYNDWRILTIKTPFRFVTFNLNGQGFLNGQDISYKFTGSGWLPSHQSLNMKTPCYVQSGYSFAISNEETNTTYYYHSVNGGQSWGSRPLPQNPNAHYNDIKFINNNTGWIVGNKDGFSFVMKTTNFGLNWTFQNDLSYPDITSIYVKDSLTIFMTPYYTSEGENKILKSSDGGQTWISQPINVISRLKKVFFVDSLNGWLFSDSAKYMTTSNGGTSWNQSIFPSNLKYRSNFFIDKNTGWIGGTDGKILKTTNGGVNWSLQLAMNNEINSIYFQDTQSGWACNSSGTLLKTNNGGNNWIKEIDPLDNIDGLACISNNLIFAFKGSNVYKLTENGQKNSLVLSTSGSPIESYIFNDSTLHIRTNSKIYRTSNRGSNWVSNLIPLIRECKFINQSTGFAIANDSTHNIYRTTNKGETWEVVSSLISYNLLDINFINVNTGFLTCSSDSILRVLRSIDSGNDWEELYTTNEVGSHNRFNIVRLSETLCLVEQSYFYFIFPITYAKFKIFGSTDIGLSWNERAEVLIGGLVTHETKFANDNVGYTAIIWNGLRKSTDAGYSFHNTSINSPRDVKSFYFEGNNGWALGDSGVIMTSSEITIGIQNTSIEIPLTHYLHQNYPNPFNPSTKIKFDVPKGSLVRLKVYDMLGREVAELVNEKLNAGVYEYEWNGVGLPSGVYFYKLESETFVETKRMVLVK